MNLSFWKQVSQILFRQQSHLRKKPYDLCLRRSCNKAPWCEPPQQVLLNTLWKIVDEKGDKMRLNRKPSVWRLYPVGFANSLNLHCEAFLVVVSTEVLDDGIAEHDLKLAITIGQASAISLDIGELGWRRFGQVWNIKIETGNPI